MSPLCSHPHSLKAGREVCYDGTGATRVTGETKETAERRKEEQLIASVHQMTRSTTTIYGMSCIIITMV